MDFWGKRPTSGFFTPWMTSSLHPFLCDFLWQNDAFHFFYFIFFSFVCVCVFFPVCLSLHIYLLLSTRSTSLHTCGHWILTVQEDLLNRVLRGKMKFSPCAFLNEKLLWIYYCTNEMMWVIDWETTAAPFFFFFFCSNKGVSEVQVSRSHNLPVFVVLFASLLQSCQTVLSESSGQSGFLKVQHSASATRGVEVKK